GGCRLPQRRPGFLGDRGDRLARGQPAARVRRRLQRLALRRERGAGRDRRPARGRLPTDDGRLGRDRGGLPPRGRARGEADPARAGAFLAQFYGRDLLATDDPLYSHRVRFANTARCLRLLRPDFAAGAAGSDPAERLIRTLPPRFAGFSPLARAQYLEVATFFEGYLLHAQGDR